MGGGAREPSPLVEGFGLFLVRSPNYELDPNILLGVLILVLLFLPNI